MYGGDKRTSGIHNVDAARCRNIKHMGRSTVGADYHHSSIWHILDRIYETHPLRGQLLHNRLVVHNLVKAVYWRRIVLNGLLRDSNGPIHPSAEAMWRYYLYAHERTSARTSRILLATASEGSTMTALLPATFSINGFKCGKCVHPSTILSAPASISGSIRARTAASAREPAVSPFSTSSTSSSATVSMIFTAPATRAEVWRYNLPLNVPRVASTPTTPVLEPRAAGFTAGSMPTNGTCGHSLRSTSIAAAVAVLHATTTTSHPRPIRVADMVRERSTISSAGLLPYGQFSVSAK